MMQILLKPFGAYMAEREDTPVFVQPSRRNSMVSAFVVHVPNAVLRSIMPSPSSMDQYVPPMSSWSQADHDAVIHGLTGGPHRPVPLPFANFWDGRLRFTDGRKRTQGMLELGVSEVPMEVSPETAKALRDRFGLYPMPSNDFPDVEKAIRAFTSPANPALTGQPDGKSRLSDDIPGLEVRAFLAGAHLKCIETRLRLLRNKDNYMFADATRERNTLLSETANVQAWLAHARSLAVNPEASRMPSILPANYFTMSPPSLPPARTPAVKGPGFR